MRRSACVSCLFFAASSFLKQWCTCQSAFYGSKQIGSWSVSASFFPQSTSVRPPSLGQWCARSVFYFPFAVLLPLPTTPQGRFWRRFEKDFSNFFSILNTEKIQKCQGNRKEKRYNPDKRLQRLLTSFSVAVIALKLVCPFVQFHILTFVYSSYIMYSALHFFADMRRL